ncbi:MAG: hypothetical protein H6739_41450 [Alphaproteobacteria bacterium]|nr:hypothetical protein [Alphaproteobacteria bacterium]
MVEITLTRKDDGAITEQSTWLDQDRVALEDGQSRSIPVTKGRHKLVVRVMGLPGASSTVSVTGDDLTPPEPKATAIAQGDGFGVARKSFIVGAGGNP